MGRSLDFVLWSLESVTKDGERRSDEGMRKQKPNILDDVCYGIVCRLAVSICCFERDFGCFLDSAFVLFRFRGGLRHVFPI